MYDPVRASGPLEFLAELQTLPRSMGVDIEQTPVRNSSEIEQSFSALADKPNTGLIVYSGGATVENRDTIILEAAKHKIPAVYRDRGYVVAGGLASYGADSRESTLGAANYIDRILQGAKPNELPAQRPTKFQLVFNLKVAKVLGVDETVRRDSAANDAFVFDNTAIGTSLEDTDATNAAASVRLAGVTTLGDSNQRPRVRTRRPQHPETQPNRERNIDVHKTCSLRSRGSDHWRCICGRPQSSYPCRDVGQASTLCAGTDSDAHPTLRHGKRPHQKPPVRLDLVRPGARNGASSWVQD